MSIRRLDADHRLKSLDSRELLALELIFDGQPNKVLQRRLGLSRRTVERVRASILEKTGSLSFVELAFGLAGTAADREPRTADMDSKEPTAWDETRGHAPISRPDEETQCDEDHRLVCCQLEDAARYASEALSRIQAMESSRHVSEGARPPLRRVGALLSAALRDIRNMHLAAGIPRTAR